MRDLSAVKAALTAQVIETPSWGYGNSGTRFKVFTQPGVPRDPYEKLDDAAQVHAATGVAPVVSLHIPWDRVDDYAALALHAKERGLRLGAINANVFQDDDVQTRLGHQPRPRRTPQGRRTTCSSASTSWTPPDRATSSSGSPTAPTTPARTTSPPARTASPKPSPTVYERLGDRPADAARVQALRARLLHHRRARLGHRLRPLPHASATKAQVVVDTGHHAPGTNIEFIVAFLLRQEKLGGFDFNSRFYADDDLMVGAADPFQLFRILHEVAKNDGFDAGDRGGVHARPVPQHRGEDPGRHPLGDERPGGHRQGAAGRPGRAARRAARPATCWAPTPC